MTTRWQSVARPRLCCWIRKTEKAQVHHLKAGRRSHSLKAADLIISSPELGEENPIDNLSAASLTSGVPEFTAPAMAQLKKAKKDDIRAEIKAVLDAAEAAGEKPPNTKQLPNAVLPRLIARGLKETKSAIQKLAPEFKSRLWPQGKRWSSR
jgi:hypothetical protein